jgi:hypothetical protein
LADERPTFSLGAYREVLDTARRNGWRFGRFDTDGPVPARTVLLRHDVDYSVEVAVELAQANADAGAIGTFFLLLGSNLYNLHSAQALHAARAIAALGQRIGLHYAVPDEVPPVPAAVTGAINREHRLLRELVPADAVFAWHNPTPPWLERYAGLDVPGLVNVYAPRFTSAMRYRSDSNLRHAPADFVALLGSDDPTPVQLLFHPLNWVIGGNDMKDVLAGAWGRVVRVCEHDFLTNSTYRACLPHGMPDEALTGFVRAWTTAARGGCNGGSA